MSSSATEKNGITSAPTAIDWNGPIGTKPPSTASSRLSTDGSRSSSAIFKSTLAISEASRSKGDESRPSTDRMIAGIVVGIGGLIVISAIIGIVLFIRKRNRSMFSSHLRVTSKVWICTVFVLAVVRDVFPIDLCSQLSALDVGDLNSRTGVRPRGQAYAGQFYIQRNRTTKVFKTCVKRCCQNPPCNVAFYVQDVCVMIFCNASWPGACEPEETTEGLFRDSTWLTVRPWGNNGSSPTPTTRSGAYSSQSSYWIRSSSSLKSATVASTSTTTTTTKLTLPNDTMYLTVGPNSSSVSLGSTPAMSKADQLKRDKSWSIGAPAIAGIVVGVIGGLIVISAIVGIVLFIRKRNRNKNEKSSQESESPSVDDPANDADDYAYHEFPSHETVITNQSRFTMIPGAYGADSNQPIGNDWSTHAPYDNAMHLSLPVDHVTDTSCYDNAPPSTSSSSSLVDTSSDLTLEDNSVYHRGSSAPD